MPIHRRHVSGSGDVRQQMPVYVTPDAEDEALDNTAADMCARRGGNLPVLRTKGEVSDLRLLLYYSRHYAKTQKLCASLQSNVS
jgi:hypothetical protein